MAEWVRLEIDSGVATIRLDADHRLLLIQPTQIRLTAGDEKPWNFLLIERSQNTFRIIGFARQLV